MRRRDKPIVDFFNNIINNFDNLLDNNRILIRVDGSIKFSSRLLSTSVIETVFYHRTCRFPAYNFTKT